MTIRTPGRALASVGLCALLSACGGMHDARPMSAVEKQTFVARNPPQKVPEVEGLTSIGARTRIDAPPGKVWQVLAVGFGELDRWAGSGVAESECTSGDHGELGAIRSCKIADHMPLFGGDYYEEKIVSWARTAGYFSVLQTRATGPTSLLLNENWISADGREGSPGTVVTQLVHVDVNFPAGMMGVASTLKRKLVEGQIGLKHYCETGELVTAENWEAIVEKYPEPLQENGV